MDDAGVQTSIAALMQPPNAAIIGLLLFVACLVAIVTRRLRLPYSVGLVLAGLGLAAMPGTIDLQLTPALIFSIFLPPLIFEAAIQVP